MIHALGKPLGTLVYHLVPKYRKRALSNLSLATDLDLTPEEVKRLAEGSLQSLAITALEYLFLPFVSDISRIATCENPEKANELMAEGKGVIFFCGHQANWELLFLEGTSRMPGVAIGRPIKNKWLYKRILKMREKFGGKIVPPKDGIKEGLRALKAGKFFGIVGDQGMPGSGYSSNFLGRTAHTSPIPALLAYKTGAPLIVATTRRENGRYIIHYSDPLFADQSKPKEKEVKRLMDEALALYADSIKKRPHEWLWIHNRWKQQTLDEIPRRFRYDAVAVAFPRNPDLVTKASLFKKRYPLEQLTLFVPQELAHLIDFPAEVVPYQFLAEIKIPDFRFKALYNFTGDTTIEKHFKKHSVQAIFREAHFARK